MTGELSEIINMTIVLLMHFVEKELYNCLYKQMSLSFNKINAFKYDVTITIIGRYALVENAARPLFILCIAKPRAIT